MVLPTKTFFLHIPKCAGSSIWKTLYHIHGRKHVFRVIDTDRAKELEAMPHSRRFSYLAIGGHLTLPKFRTLLGDMSDYYKIVTLRDPIDLILSYYNYVRLHSWHFEHESAVRQHFDEFVACTPTVNTQVYFLTGGSSDATKAIEAMLEFFDDWAFTHQLAGLTARLYERFRVEPQSAKHVNKNTLGLTHSEISPEAITVLKSRNQEDFELVERLFVLREKSGP
jgi:hypothetical protein